MSSSFSKLMFLSTRKVLEVGRNKNINNVPRELRKQSNVFTRLSIEQISLRFCIWVAIKFETITNGEPYYLVSQVLENNNWFSLYWEALELLKKNGVLITSDSVRALIRSYSHAGYTEKAVESFGRMREFGCEPDAHTYNTVLRGILKNELFVLALALYNTMLKSNVAPDEYTFNMLIDGFCKSENLKGAFEMLEEMQRREVVPTVMSYTSIFYGLCQAKKVDDAHRLFNLMKEKGCPFDLIACNVLLDGFCKMGRLDEALSFVSLIERDGFSLQLNGYSSLIHAFFRARRFNEAHALYARMFKDGIQLDVILYTIMIRGLSDEGRVGEAVRMLDEMIQIGLIPDAHCYNAIIKGFCDVGLLDQAQSLQLNIFNSNQQFQNACTHTILICAMCKKGMVKQAQKIFDEMEKFGCVPSVVTFNALIHGLCKARNLKEANHLLCKMEIGKRPSLFFQLSQGSDRVFDSVSLQKKVEQMCGDGQILEAYRFLTQLADSGVMPDIYTYNILINGFCKARNISGAFKLFEDLQLKGLTPDRVTYGTLIAGLYRVDREDDALRISENMQRHGCEPSLTVCNSLMTSSCRKGKVSQAFSLYFDYLKNLRGRDNDSICALEKYFVRGNVEQTIRGLLELDFRARDFNLAPYTILLIGFCQARKVNAALIILSVLDEFNIKINATSCVHLIKALCKERKLDIAIQIFLYSLDNGFSLKPAICDQLLARLLVSEDKKEHTVDIIDRMKSFGYCFEHRRFHLTLYLLNRYQKGKANKRHFQKRLSKMG